MKCDMYRECAAPVTHIGERGFIYRKEHALVRRSGGAERTRAMRAWECAAIAVLAPISYEYKGNHHD